jgi:DNA-binding transcriptional ArsR family regulator
MDVFEAVAEPHRRALLEVLADGPRPAGLSQPAVSRHLRMLREAGLVEVQAVAQRRIYSIRPAALQELDQWIGRYRRLWASHLDALERHLDEAASNGQAHGHTTKD